MVSDRPSLIVSGVARGGKAKEVTIGGKDMRHYAGHRARMGRVLPDKLKPQAIKVAPAAGESENRAGRALRRPAGRDRRIIRRYAPRSPTRRRNTPAPISDGEPAAGARRRSATARPCA